MPWKVFLMLQFPYKHNITVNTWLFYYCRALNCFFIKNRCAKIHPWCEIWPILFFRVAMLPSIIRGFLPEVFSMLPWSMVDFLLQWHTEHGLTREEWGLLGSRYAFIWNNNNIYNTGHKKRDNRKSQYNGKHIMVHSGFISLIMPTLRWTEKKCHFKQVYLFFSV